MAEEKIEKLNLKSVTYDMVSENLRALLGAGVPVFRKNIEGQLVTIPVEKLEQFMGETARDIELFIEDNWKAKVSARSRERRPLAANAGSALARAMELYGNTEEQIGRFQTCSVAEREEILDRSIESLHALQNGSSGFDIEAIIKMVEVIANTFYANYANLEDNLSTENVKENILGVFIKTEWIVKILIEYFRDSNSDKNFLLIEKIDTGSYTITNMCKALLWFIGFGLYYNNYIDKGLFTKNIRGNFKEKLLRYYRRRLPDVNISVETVVRGGFRRIDTEKDLVQYAVGALLYDIGKIPFIAYHDGNEAYDHEIVKLHVLTGYNMLLKTKSHSFPVRAMAAFHHEYYGGKRSYNFSAPVMGKLTGKKYDFQNADYFMTYDENEFKNGRVLSFFPCKIIEIIDVFLALTGRKKMSNFEAFKMMKTEFVTKNTQLDPLLLEMFLDFAVSCGMFGTAERGEIDAIKF